jgi:hypothetical protein
MLIFLDETFRTRKTGAQELPMGALCGLGIPEASLRQVACDVFQLKRKHLSEEVARDKELKGKVLLKRRAFDLRAETGESPYLALVSDLIRYIVRKKLPVFGTVCFEERNKEFKCTDVTALDRTFSHLFERIDMCMRIRNNDEMGILVFDDRDLGTNEKNSTAITNFFLRSAKGRKLDRIVDTPLFGISQAQNVGLQLADLVTTILGMRFQEHPNGVEFYEQLEPAIFRWQEPVGKWHSGLRVIGDPENHNRYKKNSTGWPFGPRSGQ